MKARLKIKLIKDFIYCVVLWCTAVLFRSVYIKMMYDQFAVDTVWIVLGGGVILLYAILYRLRMKEEGDLHRRRLKRLNYPDKEPWENVE